MSDLESKIEAALERALVHPCADDFSALHALLPDALAELRARAERIAELEGLLREALVVVAERDTALARAQRAEGVLDVIAKQLRELVESAEDVRVRSVFENICTILNSEVSP